MGLRIRTNIASLSAQRSMSQTSFNLVESMQKLSSGQRINKAADDAAGLGISESLRSQIVSLNQAKRNAADGISIIQTAEGGLTESTNLLVRLRELAVQSASDTISDRERNYVQGEYHALRDEIDRIANTVEYNGTKLLIGDRSHVPKDLEFTNQNDFPLHIQVGKDYRSATDGDAVRNPNNVIRLDLAKIDGYAAGLGLGGNGDSDEMQMATRDGAEHSIGMLDGALNKIAEYRAYLGSTQNRLNSTLSNMAVYIENLQSSRSVINDTDFAQETANFTQQNIIQKAGESVLSQANQTYQVVLNLLR